MPSRQRIIDYLAAISIVVAFGGLFFGRLMIYPVSKAPGAFLERVAAKSEAWDSGHRLMLLGMIALIPAAIALRRTVRKASPLLCDVAATLAILGATLGVGQYALDFAMLHASQMESTDAREQFLHAWETGSFVQWVFYELPDLGQLGLILFAVALWKLGAGWRLQAVLVTLAAATSVFGPLLVGPMGVRIALGLGFLGFSTLAWKIAKKPRQPNATTG